MSVRGVRAFVLLALTACSSKESADVLFINGNVYTVDDATPRAQAIAVRGGLIVGVGSNDELAKYRGSGTEVIDLAGATVVPGFADAHAHLYGIGEREQTLNLEGTTTKEDFIARFRDHVKRARPGEWIVGRGWIETFWKPPVFPTRFDLDSLSPNNPVLLTRVDGHAALANTKALELAGISPATKVPNGGAVKTDGNGRLTGMLIDNAMSLVAPQVRKPTAEDVDSTMAIAARRSVQVGWTQIQDAGGSWEEIESLRRLYRAGRLKLRVYKAIDGPSGAADSLLAAGSIIGEFNGRLTVRSIKLYVDGALGSRGAALLEPYSDEPQSSGLITIDTAVYAALLVKALERGIQIQTHAIGDRGNRLVLDHYGRAFDAVPKGEKRRVKDPRWRIEHAQIVDLSDIPRFKELGVIPSMEPSHAISDLYFAPSRLGPARLAGGYAWKRFIDLGLPVAGGSDAPVERGEPMIEFYAAAVRRDLKGNAGPDSLWHPELKVSRMEALEMLTRYPAFAAFEEDVRGSIAKGKWADLTVLDQDIMVVADSLLPRTNVVMTVIGGEIVYRK